MYDLDNLQALCRSCHISRHGGTVHETPLPNTTAGRDAAENVRQGVLRGLSVEFRSEQEGRRGGVRERKKALLGAAALVDSGAYKESTVEIRAGQAIVGRPRAQTLWL